ncbi:MAG TPA: hypothetical protein ENK02_02665 [Planctomycetes bacterium]|nr:hypothetical protein [Planctomycetota bacterium]
MGKRAQKPPWLFETQKQLSEATGINITTLRHWIQDLGCECKAASGRGWDLRGLVQFIRSRFGKKPGPIPRQDFSEKRRPEDRTLDPTYWEARKKRADAIKAELVLRVQKKELIHVRGLDKLLEMRAMEFRRGLEVLEEKLPNQFPEVEKELREAMHREVRHLLERYSRPDALLSGEEEPAMEEEESQAPKQHRSKKKRSRSRTGKKTS